MIRIRTGMMPRGDWLMLQNALREVRGIRMMEARTMDRLYWRGWRRLWRRREPPYALRGVVDDALR